MHAITGAREQEGYGMARGLPKYHSNRIILILNFRPQKLNGFGSIIYIVFQSNSG